MTVQHQRSLRLQSKMVLVGLQACLLCLDLRNIEAAKSKLELAIHSVPD
jgi:hypothetical protein